MQADIEDLVLSGRLFSNDGTASPPRAPSPTGNQHLLNSTADQDWPSDPEKDGEYDSDKERSAAIDRSLASYGASSQNGYDYADGEVGVGKTGRTGVKGVIRDRAEASALAREKRARDVKEMNRKMEKASLGGKTYLEEEREKREEEQRADGRKERGDGSAGKPKRFGHLREVGRAGFLPAIEDEARDVWVVIHIYDPGLNRCDILDDTLAQLARQHERTKFIRVRAKAIGFATTSSTTTTTTTTSNARASRVGARLVEVGQDEDDPYAYGDGGDGGDDDDGDDDGDDNVTVDTDMLPTVLVYRAGDLVHNWVRVDWEAGVDGVEALLLRNRVISGPGASDGNLGFLSDDDDLDEGELELEFEPPSS